MSFTVIWLPASERELTRLWLDPVARAAISAASDEIDYVLARDPFSVGESREDDRRILLIWPLGVTYVVSDDDRIVQVREVWRFD